MEEAIAALPEKQRTALLHRQEERRQGAAQEERSHALDDTERAARQGFAPGALLTRDGLMLLHTIGHMDGPWYPNPWLDKYIFPGGMLPALSDMVGRPDALFSRAAS